MYSDDEFRAAGLLEPGDSTDFGGADNFDVDSRLKLLQWLDSMGVTLEQMVAADATSNLSAIAGDRRMVPGERLSVAEAAELIGLPVSQVEAYATALGFVPLPDSTTGQLELTADEANTIGAAAFLSEVFSPAEALAAVRVIGSSFARLGESVVSLFLADIEGPHVSAGASEFELAHKVYDAVGMLDGFADRFDPVLRRHVAQAVGRTRQATVGDSRLMFRFAVGFVDLVGFTERTQSMPADQLATFIREFEGRAHDTVTQAGARVVKLIGDEVMFVSVDAASACRAAWDLTEAFGEEHDRVLPRGGLAFGDVLPRGGDYYGSVVNLAARLVDQAVPQEVLVTSEVVEAAANQCTFEPAGRRMMKGFQQPVLTWSLVTPEPPPAN